MKSSIKILCIQCFYMNDKQQDTSSLSCIKFQILHCISVHKNASSFWNVTFVPIDQVCVKYALILRKYIFFELLTWTYNDLYILT
jgi:hypothetical protein